MTQSTTDPNAVIISVDTHKDTHAAVAINGLGARLGDRIIPTTPAGYQQLLEWAKTFGGVAAFGVEGTGSYGKGLSQFLRRQGLKVVEVSRPCRRGQQRLQGKDDLLDAEDAARQVLAGQATATPKLDEGAMEMIRILKAARDTAVKAQTQVMVALKTMIITAHRLNRGSNRQANAALFRVVLVRMRWHEPTRTYVARRTAQGLSKREIIRCLKRYVAREIYHLIRKPRLTPEGSNVTPA